MSNLPQSLEMQRLDALAQLDQRQQQAWRVLHEKQDAELKVLMTDQEKERDYLFSQQKDQIRIIRNSDNPLQEVECFTDKQDHGQLKPAYKLSQSELDTVQTDVFHQNPAGIENMAEARDKAENLKPKNPIEQAHFDLSKDRSSSPFDDIAKYKDRARNDFNQVSDPFNYEQTNSREK